MSVSFDSVTGPQNAKRYQEMTIRIRQASQ